MEGDASVAAKYHNQSAEPHDILEIEVRTRSHTPTAVGALPHVQIVSKSVMSLKSCREYYKNWRTSHVQLVEGRSKAGEAKLKSKIQEAWNLMVVMK